MNSVMFLADLLSALFVFFMSLCTIVDVFVIQGSQVSCTHRETHAFHPVHTLSRHTLYFSRDLYHSQICAKALLMQSKKLSD